MAPDLRPDVENYFKINFKIKKMPVKADKGKLRPIKAAKD
jgi:hypothetical protein